MRFRAKILLSILLPASVLVAATMAAALLRNRRDAEIALRETFETTQTAVAEGMEDRRATLMELANACRGPVFQEIVDKGAEPSDRLKLAKSFDYHLQEIKRKPDYIAAATADGMVWLQRYFGKHTCVEPCPHSPATRWAKSPDEMFFQGVNGFYLARRLIFLDDEGNPAVEGGLVVARSFGDALRRVAEMQKVRIDLYSGGTRAFSTQEASSPAALEGEVWIDGIRHVAGRSTLGSLGELVLYRSMADVDRRSRETVVLGIAALALAVLIAALVSTRVSRGISRPVESLVDATHKVGAGDYSAQVSIPGSDEMARLGTAFNEMTEGLRKRREIMEKTLSRDVAEELMKGVELGGERRRVTILFTDVRGFTSGTEGVDPAEVVTMLNDMMNFLAEAISKQGGNVNKFLGDGIMAMFGAPKDLPDHAFRAVQAALEMQKEMAGWNVRRSGRGLPPFNVGIGINTGTVLGGKVGSRNRLEYTLIGEEVNLSSRICGKAAPGQVLITKATLAELGGRVRVRELEPIHVKGLSYPVSIYEVQG